MEKVAVLRGQVTTVLLAIAWIHVPLAFLVAWSTGASLAWIGGGVAGLALMAHAINKFGNDQATGRALLAVALQGQVAFFVAAPAGHPWQTDMHMYFFAVMGLIAVLIDATAIVAAAIAVAVHHLSLNLLAAELVFPGGSDLGRTALHAVILILETIALTFLSVQMVSTLTKSAEMEKALAHEAELAEEANAAAEETRRNADAMRDQMLDHLDSALGGAARAAEMGDVSYRVAESDALNLSDMGEAEAERFRSFAGSVDAVMISVSRYLDALQPCLEQYSLHNLGQRIDGDFKGRFGVVAGATNAAFARLAELVGSVQQAGKGISRVAQEATHNANGLATRAHEQSVGLQETAATIEQMSSTIAANAVAAREAKSEADGARQRAESSASVAEQAVGAMTGLASSSKKVAEIVGVIDGIAFQTNLLALNAAVEAARAGDAGKGFAVVASEVRTLAQRSSEAAQDIRELIDESAKQVDHSVGLVEQSGSALSEMLESIGQVAERVAAITRATSEQAQGVDQIVTTVSQLDSAGSETSRIAAELSESASALNATSEDLASTVGAFSIGQRGESALDEEWSNAS